ncbi:MAG: hypothetical protein KKE61_15520, partial [Proteobacteria bacterium]|nr:hypothetical protein [Pseudomonadota bacterium]
YLFFVWVGLFALICASQFWLSAGLFFNVREAKRLFGPIGSGAILGGIIGGYITKLLAPSWGSNNLIVISIVCLFLCILIMKKLWKTHGQPKTDSRPDLRTIDSIDQKTSFSQIIKSRHLSFLAAILGISVIVSRLVDYQFNVIVSSNISDKDQLAAFLGFWMSNLNILSLLVQLFITRKIMELLGVGYSLFFLPAAVLTGAVFTFFHPALWSAVIIKLNEGGFKNSLNKSGMELLFLPIPLHIKNQAKTFIDIFVDSAASGIGGLILVFLVFGANISPSQISIVILFLVLLWFLLIRRVKKEYIRSFKDKFELDPETAAQTLGPLMDNEEAIKKITRVLEGSDDMEVLKTLQMITEFHNEKLAPCFVRLLDHSHPQIRMEALKQLYFSKKVTVLEQATALTLSDSISLKTEAIRYLFHHSQERHHSLKTFLEDPDYRIRGAALLCLVREARMNRSLKKMFTPDLFIEKTLLNIQSLSDPEQVAFTKKICIQAISTADIHTLYPYLYILMDDTDQAVVIAAIQGAGQTQDPDFVEVLLPFLNRKPALRDAAITALTYYGSQTLDLLSSCLSNTYLPYNIRKHLPEVIAASGSQKAVDILAHHLKQQDLGLRYETIRALNKLRIKSNTLVFDKAGIVPRIKNEAGDYMDMLMILYSQKQLEPLKKRPGISRARAQLTTALENRMDASLERLFRLLGLKYPPVEMYSAYKGIRSQDREMRLNAMEFLDNVLEINLKNTLMPIIETGSIRPEEMSYPPREEIPEEYESYVTLLQGHDDFLKEKTLYLLSFIEDERYIPHMAKLLNSPVRGVRNMARFALEKTGRFQISSRSRKKTPAHLPSGQ